MNPCSQLCEVVRTNESAPRDSYEGRKLLHRKNKKSAHDVPSLLGNRVKVEIIIIINWINTPFPLTSHTDLNYTSALFCYKSTVDKVLFSWQNKWNWLFVLGSEILWFTDTWLCIRRCLETIQWHRLAVVCLVALSEQLLSNLVLCRSLL